MEVADRQFILAPGDKLRCYRIDSFLGQGGFGVTYLAHDTMLDLQVAIKEYLPEKIAERVAGNKVQPKGDENRALFQRGLVNFLKEARTLARFKHPNIVRVMSIFELNGTAYIVMEYEHGHDLKLLLSRGEPASEKQLLSIVGPVIDGLDEVHRLGFIHRDIKPANILVRDNGSPVLLDFGSARMAVGGENATTMTAMVSVGFAPLEQYSGLDEQQGPWTDIYALGAVLYYAITGEAPLDSTLRGAAVLNDKSDPFVSLVRLAPAGFSEAFCQAVDWSLQFKVSERPQTLQQWRAKLFKLDIHDGQISDTKPLTAAQARPDSTSSRIVPGAQPRKVVDAPTIVKSLPANRPADSARGAARLGSARTVQMDDKWDMSAISPRQPIARSRSIGLPIIALIVGSGLLLAVFRPWELLRTNVVPDELTTEISDDPAPADVAQRLTEPFTASTAQSTAQRTEQQKTEEQSLVSASSSDATSNTVNNALTPPPPPPQVLDRPAEIAETEQASARLQAQEEVDRAVQRAEARRLAALQAESERRAEAQRAQEQLAQKQAELEAARKRQASSQEAARLAKERNAVRPPISNAELNAVLTRFNALSNAIEAGDGDTMRRLTVQADQKNAYFDYAFRSFAKIEASVSNISVSRQDQKVRATITIGRLVFDNGSTTFAPEEFKNIPIYSVKEAQWSDIHW